MHSFFSEARVRQLSVFWSALIIVGIFLSLVVRVLPSIGVAGLFVTSVGYAISHKCIAQRARWPQLLSFGLVYALHLATGLAHAPLTDEALQQDLLQQLPFVLLPVSFLLLPDWRAQQQQQLWLLLLGCCVVAAVGTTGNYILHNERIDQLYLQSQVMPTAPDHIRFSLLVSMAVLAGATLAFHKGLPRRVRLLTAGAVVLLFLFQHLLAVRSGIVTMYAGGVAWLGWLGWELKQRKLMLAGIALMLVLGSGCLLLFPTLQNKIINTRTDTAQMQTVESADNFSITGRVYSYKVAWAIIQAHPLLGVSKVRLTEAMAQQYSYRYPELDAEHYLLPHSQFIYNLAAYGVLGLLVFLLGFYYPLWVGLRERNILLLLIYLVVTLSFTVEYTLESQIGVLTGLFFTLLAGAPTAPAGALARR